ncbi:unnamed protein product [Caenorhabditis auriculariae]|uniref:Endonuclease/exonuclease/phosphatase domain-containing protein n=1 Tax=Caenorhabditis auriculariae TaxID=2777116 RepID=A0A8S1HZM0_9PELO|nr:unnamed protein product [Caenorhabditis auriculariae]
MYHLSAVMGINDHLWRQRHKWRLTPWQGNEDNQTTKKLKHVQQDGPSPPPVGHAPLRYRGLPLPTRGDQISEQQDTIETDYGRATVTVYVSEPSTAARSLPMQQKSNCSRQTETHSSTYCKTWPNGELLILGHKVPGKNVGGVGFLVNRSVQHLVDSHEIVNARLGILRLNLGKRGRLTIINVYSPTSPEAESKAKREEKEKELDDFYRKLEETIQREKAYYIFVLGDFNAKMGKCATPSIQGSTTATLFEKPDRRRWTWKSPNGDTTNEIDHILANRKWSLLDVAVLPSFDVGSDHRLVRAKVRLNQKFLKKDYHQPSRPRRPTYDITTLEEKISEHDWQLLDDPTADYESLCDGLIRCAEPAARPTSSLPPRLDQLAKDLLRRRGEVRRDPQATHLERLTIDKACRMAVQESLANRRRSALLQTAEKRQSLKKKKFELVDERTVMTALKDENGQLKTSRNEMERLTVDFYTKLFRSDVPVDTDSKVERIAVRPALNAHSGRPAEGNIDPRQPQSSHPGTSFIRREQDDNKVKSTIESHFNFNSSAKVTENNYDLAIKLLQETYGNESSAITNLYRDFLTIEGKGLDTKAQKELLQSCKIIINQLVGYGENLNSLLHTQMMVEKFNTQIRRDVLAHELAIEEKDWTINLVCTALEAAIRREERVRNQGIRIESKTTKTSQAPNYSDHKRQIIHGAEDRNRTYLLFLRRKTSLIQMSPKARSNRSNSGHSKPQQQDAYAFTQKSSRKTVSFEEREGR